MQENKWWLDASIAAGLAVILLFVVILDKFLPSAATSGGKTENPLTKTTTTTKTGAVPLRIGVTPSDKDEKTGYWDDMGRLLDSMGQGYKYRMVPVDELRKNPKGFQDFDILFYTCGTGGKEPALTAGLQKFVADGGTLYASDFRYESILKAFPDFIPLQDPYPGQEKQKVVADVVDSGLRDMLGTATVPLYFDLGYWKPAVFKRSDRLKILLEGNYIPVTQDGRRLPETRAPLLVKFQFGKGTVIFTSFHNEKQNSEIELKLLKYLVFSAVTASVESQVVETMQKGGFSPQKSNLLSASRGDQTVTQEFVSKKTGTIRFTLGFENRGAKLKLTVISPSGVKFEEEGPDTIWIEQKNPGGTWRYTVTALSVPFADFPFTLTIGEKD